MAASVEHLLRRPYRGEKSLQKRGRPLYTAMPPRYCHSFTQHCMHLKITGKDEIDEDFEIAPRSYVYPCPVCSSAACPSLFSKKLSDLLSIAIAKSMSKSEVSHGGLCWFNMEMSPAIGPRRC